MRRIKLHDPNGKMIYCNVKRFLGVNINGREEFILEYDEVAGLKGRHYVVVREDNTFRLRPFNTSEEFNDFLDASRRTRVREYNLELLPEDLRFCRKALTSNSPNLRVNPTLGMGPRPYIEYVEPSRSLERARPIEGMGHITSKFVTPAKATTYTSETVTKYAPPQPDPVVWVEHRVEPTTKYAPPQPTIITKHVIEPTTKYAPPQPDPVVRVGYNQSAVCKYAPPPPTTTEKVLVEPFLDGPELIETLYERIPDFEDYYSFFGIEEMRGMSYEEIFFSEKMKHIFRVIKQGTREGDPVALSLFEFYDGFKQSVKNNLTLK